MFFYFYSAGLLIGWICIYIIDNYFTVIFHYVYIIYPIIYVNSCLILLRYRSG